MFDGSGLFEFHKNKDKDKGSGLFVQIIGYWYIYILQGAARLEQIS